MVEKLLLIKIGGNSKYTGQRVAKKVEKINSLRYRVILLNDAKVFVESVTIIKEIEKKA